MDDEFAQTEEAVAGTSAEGCEWTSLADLGYTTVYNNVDPSDLHQGSLGDCWLISAMASLAEYSNVVEGLIKENGDSFTVRLYSYAEGRFVNVEVNDMVPCQGGNPTFVKPTADGETWPCLIEKAFAKIGGGYINIKGGWSIYAFGMMKGSTDLYLYRQSGAEGDYDALIPSFSEDNLKSGVAWENGDPLGIDEMFDELVACNANQYLMCVGSNAGDDTDASGQGVVQGHAYSILDVREVGGFQLLQLRNPWGKGEYTGPWSDGAPEWADNPDVADELQPEDKEDGAFWMSWEAFQTQYTSVYICKSKRTQPAGNPPGLLGLLLGCL
jgi:hypothetical protein